MSRDVQAQGDLEPRRDLTRVYGQDSLDDLDLRGSRTQAELRQGSEDIYHHRSANENHQPLATDPRFSPYHPHILQLKPDILNGPLEETVASWSEDEMSNSITSSGGDFRPPAWMDIESIEPNTMVPNHAHGRAVLQEATVSSLNVKGSRTSRHRSHGENDSRGWCETVSHAVEELHDNNAGGFRRCKTIEAEADENDSLLLTAARTRLPRSETPLRHGIFEPWEVTPLPALETGFEGVKAEESEEGRNNHVANPAHEALSSRKSYPQYQIKAQILHRHEPIESIMVGARSVYSSVTRSWARVLLSTLVALLGFFCARLLLQPAPPVLVPDLVRVAGVARSFEPLVYFSEHGMSQIEELHATGIAVWDLSESIRGSNMSSSPAIAQGLDGLSASFKLLGTELGKFSAAVNGDMDGILNVMDWVRRELANIQSVPETALSAAYNNFHHLLLTAGVLEDSVGKPTAVGHVTTMMFGLSRMQMNRRTLMRTFREFLSVLEEVVTKELEQSVTLFMLFDSIDQQINNIQRMTVRETTNQEVQQNDLLASLWVRLLGARSNELRSFNRNKDLLNNVREKTLSNKAKLVDHNLRLQTLQASMENLRRKLISPLLRGDSSTLTIEQQIEGIEEVGRYLEEVRREQKSKLIQVVYGGARRTVG